jgi:hypothetical protein
MVCGLVMQNLFTHISGTNDELVSRLIDGYRYRNSQDQKTEIRKKIKKMTAEGGVETDKPVKKKPKRLPEVYLVNRVKYHSVVSDEDLLIDISPDNIDEKGHQIIQQKIR